MLKFLDFLRVNQTAWAFFVKIFVVFGVVKREGLIAFGSGQEMVFEIIFIRVLITDVFIGRELR